MHRRLLLVCACLALLAPHAPAQAPTNTRVMDVVKRYDVDGIHFDYAELEEDLPRDPEQQPGFVEFVDMGIGKVFHYRPESLSAYSVQAGFPLLVLKA